MFFPLLLFFCLYLPFQIALNPAPGIDLASVRILAIGLFLFWLIRGLKNKKIFLGSKIFFLLLFSFIFLSAFSFFFSENLDWSLRKMSFLLSFFPLFFIFRDEFVSKQKERRIMSFLIWSGAALSVVAIFQFILQFAIGLDPALALWSQVIRPFTGEAFSSAILTNPSWLVGISGHTLFRAIGFFPDPHMLSFYLGMLAPLSFFLYFADKKSNCRLLYLSLIILLADLLTFSRGGYAGLAGGLVIASISIFRSKYNFKIKQKSYLIATAAVFLVMLFSPFGQRFISIFDLSEGSNAGRIETWRQSFSVITKNPFGVGIGNYPLKIKPNADYREPIYSHNLYFDIAAETGIFTALIFTAILLASAWSFWKKSRRDISSLGGLVALTIFSIHSLFETPLYSVHILPLLIIIFALGADSSNQLKK